MALETEVVLSQIKRRVEFPGEITDEAAKDIRCVWIMACNTIVLLDRAMFKRVLIH